MALPGWMVAMAVLAAPMGDGGAAQKKVAEIEDGYTRAVSGRDVAALGEFLSLEMIYVHASGITQTRQEFLDGTVAGGWQVLRARVIERRIIVGHEIAVSQGSIAYDVGRGEKPARYIAVYRREKGHWRLLCWQNTRMG